MMRQSFLSTALLCAVAVPATAHADTFKYSLVKDGIAQFTYASPVLIRTDIDATITPDACMAEGNSCTAVDFIFDPFELNSDFIEIHEVTNAIYEITVPEGFFTIGNHTEGDLTLDITEQPSPPGTTPVPEPSSFALIGTGMIGIFRMIRVR